MKRFRRKRLVLTALALPVAALMGYAWVDGGRRPVTDVVESLPVPGPKQ